MSTPSTDQMVQQAATAPRLLTLAQAAATAQVSQRTIRDLQRAGRLAAVKIGRCVRVPREALEALLTSGAP
jgi:excisionase family DNA binding protein